ncbi:unnamed protein product [Medioppia subpectinata]|uniref:Uncharacterized protein n=1 Tax=Medioppia subpectinata TaxID=1979941 RepID=A0A7R9Q3D6_9ACAR|nr:unnamed protein product [Medioppia subpectinata]CAG2110344.1 unnamed protein product [Medioppia subpectinata]
MDSMEEPFMESSQPSVVSKFFTSLSQRYQSLLDTWTPHIAYRWVFTAIVFLAFMGRHMIKYRYLPWTHGKTKYQGKEDSGKVYTK